MVATSRPYDLAPTLPIDPPPYNSRQYDPSHNATFDATRTYDASKVYEGVRAYDDGFEKVVLPLNDSKQIAPSSDVSGKCEAMHAEILIIVCVTHCMMGFSMGAISPAMEPLTRHFALSQFLRGFVGACPLIGNLVGSFMGGWAADRFGRKKALIWSWSLFIVSSFSQAVAWSPFVLLFFRSLLGWSIGAHYSSVTAYLSEILPKRSVDRLLSIVEAHFFFGNFVAIAAGLVIRSLVQSDNANWRLCFGVELVPVIFTLTQFILRAPESPKWMFSHSLTHQGTQTRQYTPTVDTPYRPSVAPYRQTTDSYRPASFRPDSFQPTSFPPDYVPTDNEMYPNRPAGAFGPEPYDPSDGPEFNPAAPIREDFCGRHSYGDVDVYRGVYCSSSSSSSLHGCNSIATRVSESPSNLWSLMFFVSTFWGSLVLPTYAVSAFAISLIEGLGTGIDPFVLNTWLGCSAVVGVGLGVALVGGIGSKHFLKVGPKGLLLLSQWGVAVALILMAVSKQWGFSNPTANSWVMISGFLSFEVLNGAGAPLAMIYPARVFPSHLRGRASGLCAMNSRIIAVIGIFGTSMILPKFGPANTLLSIAAISGLGALITHLMAPSLS